jgi:Carboxypeptidase regulatory-like domain
LLTLITLQPLATSPARAQSNSAALVGTVRDSAGVPKAGVQFIVGSMLVTNSDSAGRFVLDNVQPGRREIRVIALGFYRMTLSNVEFVAGDTLRLDFRLVPIPWRHDECLTVEGCREAAARRRAREGSRK